MAAVFRARRLALTAGLLSLLLATTIVAARSEPAIHEKLRPLKLWAKVVDDPATADSAWAGIAAYMQEHADSSERAFGWYLLYCAAQANGRIDSMRVAAESSMVYAPNDPSGFRDLAIYLAKAGHHLELAETAAHRTLDTPHQPIQPAQRRQDMRWLAHIQRKRGHLQDAIATYESCVTELDTPDDYALRHLGWIYAGQGRADEAIDRLTRGLSAYPVDSVSSVELGQLLDSLVTAKGGDAAAVNARIERDRASAKRRYWLENYRVGKPAPRTPFLAADLSKQQDLGAGRGITVLYVWATWCGPCRSSLPALDAWAVRPRTKPVRFVTVNTEGEPLDQARIKVEKFFGEKHLSLPVAYADSATAAKWKLTGFPMTLVLKDGRIVYRDHAGGLVEGLDAQLADLGSELRP